MGQHAQVYDLEVVGLDSWFCCSEILQMKHCAHLFLQLFVSFDTDMLFLIIQLSLCLPVKIRPHNMSL